MTRRKRNEPMYPGASDQSHELKGLAIDVGPRSLILRDEIIAYAEEDARVAAEVFKAAYPELMTLIRNRPPEGAP